MDEGAVQPLDVVILREGKQDFIADDGEGQQKYCPQGHSQSEGAQPQPEQKDTKERIKMLVHIHLTLLAAQ